MQRKQRDGRPLVNGQRDGENRKEDTTVKEQTDLVFFVIAAVAVVSMFIIIAAELFVFWK